MILQMTMSLPSLIVEQIQTQKLLLREAGKVFALIPVLKLQQLAHFMLLHTVDL